MRRLEQEIEKIERRYERLENKYEGQVRGTQAIMTRANEQLIELQKASQVAQSKTLAEYLLRAKDFILGSGTQSRIDGNIDTLINFENEELSSSSFSSSYSGDLLHFQNASEDLV